MKIKTLMDFLNKENAEARGNSGARARDKDGAPAHEENVVYIENARIETAREQEERKALLAGGTQWADEAMGEESPSSIGQGCRVTPGGGDPKESATESKPLVSIAAR